MATFVCKKCGASVNEGQKFCSLCGEPQPSFPNGNVESGTQQSQAVYNTVQNQEQFKTQPKTRVNAFSQSDKTSKIGFLCNIIGAISGAISFLCGLIISGSNTGSWISFESYGGDAYTGIQHAAARTGNNVQAVAEILKAGFACLLIILGIAICCYFVSRLVEDKKR